jgi:hypothetical protein
MTTANQRGLRLHRGISAVANNMPLNAAAGMR